MSSGVDAGPDADVLAGCDIEDLGGLGEVDLDWSHPPAMAAATTGVLAAYRRTDGADELVDVGWLGADAAEAIRGAAIDGVALAATDTGFLVVASDITLSGRELVARELDASGAAIGELIALTNAAGGATAPTLVVEGSTELVGYVEISADGTRRAQVFRRGGSVTNDPFAGIEGDTLTLRLAPRDGGFLAARVTSAGNAEVRRIDINGAPTGDVQTVIEGATGPLVLFADALGADSTSGSGRKDVSFRRLAGGVPDGVSRGLLASDETGDGVAMVPFSGGFAVAYRRRSPDESGRLLLVDASGDVVDSYNAADIVDGAPGLAVDTTGAVYVAFARETDTGAVLQGARVTCTGASE